MTPLSCRAFTSLPAPAICSTLQHSSPRLCSHSRTRAEGSSFPARPFSSTTILPHSSPLVDRAERRQSSAETNTTRLNIEQITIKIEHQRPVLISIYERTEVQGSSSSGPTPPPLVTPKRSSTISVAFEESVSVSSSVPSKSNSTTLIGSDVDIALMPDVDCNELMEWTPLPRGCTDSLCPANAPAMHATSKSSSSSGSDAERTT
eukprot:CAMPEP_0173246528 /NCGR_PEP_ID=MMETSP1142-20121109/17370_1 /TAXON_ID=483371 /ORGANISM="non described non described, Strain CCMP2298" /LENGTH=204 /DNA_ID=CAMNT_0014178767 /DNA_START=510 /DNA_END=1119 /DNA_ORIENTATION=-